MKQTRRAALAALLLTGLLAACNGAADETTATVAATNVAEAAAQPTKPPPVVAANTAAPTASSRSGMPNPAMSCNRISRVMPSSTPSPAVYITPSRTAQKFVPVPSRIRPALSSNRYS